MSAPVETTAWIIPASIMRMRTMPILATVIAPEKVPTMSTSGSRAISVSTSQASPSERPLKAVLPIAVTMSSKEWILNGSSARSGSSLSSTPSLKVRTAEAALCEGSWGGS
jgi:hypothetical protein